MIWSYHRSYHTHRHTHTFYGPLDFVQHYPGKLVPETIWILLKQVTMSGSGISCTICKSFAPCSRQTTMPAPHHSVFTGLMPFLTPNQQRQSTESTHNYYKQPTISLLLLPLLGLHTQLPMLSTLLSTVSSKNQFMLLQIYLLLHWISLLVVHSLCTN